MRSNSASEARIELVYPLAGGTSAIAAASMPDRTGAAAAIPRAVGNSGEKTHESLDKSNAIHYILRVPINGRVAKGAVVEFGVFLNGYIPGPAAHDTASEHTVLMREAEYAIHADRHNWKYAWFGEHHALTEYSHMSAPEVIMGYIAARTDRIHLGSDRKSVV